MKVLLVTTWTHLRESYWFVPSLMAIGAIVLSFLTTALDNAVGSEWLEEITWLYANKPAGARAVLSTVAGSMITVAGVTFSMTILSISSTTSQVGPRLLRNFMRDRGNQFTLGVFISTFLYCLMVLRTVRNADSPPVGGAENVELAAAFVPHIAIVVGLLLAIASVGVLIYFIHHIPESIHVSNIVAGVGHDLNVQIAQQFPTKIGIPHQDPQQREPRADLPDSFYRTATKVGASCPGYIEFVDSDGLLQLAKQHDLVLKLQQRPGDFVSENNVLLLAAPRDRVDDQMRTQIQGMFYCGAQRTAHQNLRFVLNQLVEVAMRALSPGVNDPFTALNCMDWLQTGLENLASREMPDAHRLDDQQQLRIVAEPDTFDSFACMVFDQLRPYVAADRNASLHMMRMLQAIMLAASDDHQRRLLVRLAGSLRRESKRAFDDVRSRQLLSDSYRTIVKLHRDASYRQRVLETDWVDTD
ncbi:DUF2254 domain-containing protein [Roseimaritima ulvae]|uniref:DUF2254 domain-containing protein n=1 Tax=Roseimaritima ulvae TaxID=980254 RepID=A0A5B9QHT6_9BACT|nr:DUF2254 domain-containing protein [Roseimaritima ulvae]QEG38687.1 hypothetical protein UC8_06450 [Roseimaritima ulvae]